MLPLLSELGILLAYIALIVLLFWAPKLRPRWLRILSRILGVAGLVPLVIAIPALLLGLALAMGDPPAQSRVVKSSDGQQAELNYRAGFLGRDYTKVTLKHTGACQHTTVFWHAGPSDFRDPQLEWLDNRHLRIIYHTRPDDPRQCQQRVGDITIVCTSRAWPDSPVMAQPSPVKKP